MNIIVCVKQVPGTTQVAIDPVTGTLKRDGVASKLNPYDLFALEAALELKEACGGWVRTLSMGPPQAKAALDETLWMGAEEGVLLSDRIFGGADVAATSYCLSLGVEKLGQYDLIICGKQTTDGDTAQVGPELARHLGIEHAANVLTVEQAGEGKIVVTIDLDGQIQKQEMTLPCLITMEKDANTPRLPSYLRKKATQPEQIQILSGADFPNADRDKLGLKGSPTRVERIFPPEKNEDKHLLTGDGADLSRELYKLLKAEKFL